jgi:glycosyltransferase-like protein LARGE
VQDAVTVASQGSWNRLEHLQKLVKLWQGPVSFALLLDSKSQLADLDAVLAADANLVKFLDLHVAWRVDHSIDDQGAFYPINVLRNMGLQTVLTGLVFILDVDNIPSGPMSAFRKWTVEAEAAAGETASEAVCPGLDAFIPPAVEMSADRVARMYDESRERGSLPDRIAKDVLVDSFYDGTVKPMHAYFGPAYVPTNHFNWSTTHTVDPVKYLTRFEPYYLARMPIPLFNESFVNRGGNYAQQVYEMHAAGYRFFRLPTGFIVDIPHEKASMPKAKSSGPVQENRTKQAAHDEAFIANVWLAFADWVSHRYGINMPSPAVSDLMFRKYRRAQEKVTNAMWHLLGLEEALEADDDEDE